MEGRATARTALQRQDREHEDQEDRRQLCRAGRAAVGQPDPENAGRERIDAEMLHGAEFVQRLQQGERHAGDDGRPASGRATRHIACAGVQPSVRLTSSEQIDCSRNADRLSR